MNSSLSDGCVFVALFRNPTSWILGLFILLTVSWVVILARAEDNIFYDIYVKSNMYAFYVDHTAVSHVRFLNLPPCRYTDYSEKLWGSYWAIDTHSVHLHEIQVHLVSLNYFISRLDRMPECQQFDGPESNHKACGLYFEQLCKKRWGVKVVWCLRATNKMLDYLRVVVKPHGRGW